MNAPAPGKRTELVDTREIRATARAFAVRSDTNSGTVTLTGYASTFEPYEMYGGPKNYGWIEQIAPTAFDKTLREKPDLHLLINHEGMPLARTKSGTLTLSVDQVGLKVRAELDADDPDVQRLQTKMRRGDMDEMSFAFRVKAQTWSKAPGFDDEYSFRTITEVSLHKGDVSVVNFGANPATVAEVASRRRKRKDGTRVTLTRAEAEAMVAADRNWTARNSGTGGTTSAARRQTEVDAAALAAQLARGDLIAARAAQLVKAYEVRQAAVEADPDAAGQAAIRELHRTGQVSSFGAMLDAVTEARERSRKAARLAELDREREAILNPPRPQRNNCWMQWVYDRDRR